MERPLKKAAGPSTKYANHRKSKFTGGAGGHYCVKQRLDDRFQMQTVTKGVELDRVQEWYKPSGGPSDLMEMTVTGMGKGRYRDMEMTKRRGY